jgi:hypothetical protein
VRGRIAVATLQLVIVLVGVGVLVPIFSPGGYSSAFNGSISAFWMLIGASVVAGIVFLANPKRGVFLVPAVVVLLTAGVWSQLEMTFDAQSGFVEDCNAPACEELSRRHVGLRMAVAAEELFRSSEARKVTFNYRAGLLSPSMLASLARRWPNVRASHVKISGGVEDETHGFVRLVSTQGRILVLQASYNSGLDTLTPICAISRNETGQLIELPHVESHFYPRARTSGLLRAHEGTTYRSVVLVLVFVLSCWFVWIGLLDAVFLSAKLGGGT